VAERKPFLLRIDADLYAALARWADDELRSLNGQIEFLLRRALAGAGRLPTSPGRQPAHASGARRREPLSPPPSGVRAQGRSRPAAPEPANRPAEPGRRAPRAPAASPARKPPTDWDVMED
jgi:hypothetical protein